MLNTFEKTKAHEARRAAIQRQMEAMEAAATSRVGVARVASPDSVSGSSSSSANGNARQRRHSTEHIPAGSLETARRFLWDEEEEDTGTGSSHARQAPGGQSGFTDKNMYNIHGVAPHSSHADPQKSNGLFGFIKKFSSTRTVDIADATPPVSSPGDTSKKEYRPNALTSLYLCFRQLLLGIALSISNCITWFKIRWNIAMGNGRGKRLFFLIAVIVLVIILVAIFAPNRNSSSSAESNTRSSDNLSPTQRHEILFKVILETGLSDEVLVRDPKSPQNQALEWVTKEDKAQLSVSDPYILHRYALAVFYFATHGDNIFQTAIVNITQTIPPGTDRKQSTSSSQQASLPQKIGETTEVGDDLAAQPNWLNEEGWMSENGYCSWHGIECHHRSGTSIFNTKYDANAGIILLNMTENNVRGKIPAELFRVMPDLRWMSVSNNGLYGPIPSDIGGCTQLKYLSFANNFFTGELPTEVFVPTIDRLYLDGNYFVGSIPVGLPKMTNLISLSIYNNFFSGSIPDHISNLVNLTALYLDVNHLTGTIPASMGQLTKLEDLRMRHNKFTGPIPSALGDLTKLEILYLDRNSLTGSVPGALGKLTRLSEFHAYRNKLDGVLPTEMGRMKELDSLYLDNNRIVGGIPSEFGMMNDLDEVYLHKNYMNGTIPTEIGNMENLRNFRIYTNGMVGTIPTEIGNAFKLEDIYVQDNMFTGTLPSQMKELNRLARLRIYWNKLTGDAPKGVCDLMDYKLTEFKSDCAGDNPKYQCSCCTACFA